MDSSPLIKKSFFLRFLLWTVFVGNAYLLLQSIFHSINIHQLDNYLRWYPFKAAPAYNLLLVLPCLVTMGGAYTIYTKGRSGFQSYFMGKIAATLAFLVLTTKEYSISGLSYPFTLGLLVVAVEMIYPIIIYISLRKVSSRYLPEQAQ